jgi:2-dehydro-3-deoxygalactonokinase
MKNVFLSCDWGTSSFRLTAVQADNKVCLGELHNDTGIAAIYNRWQSEAISMPRFDFYIEFIKSNIQKLESDLKMSFYEVPLIVSGMASASIGMKELPYKKMPFALDGTDLLVELIAASNEFPYPMLIISGATNETDVMRGEEVQLVGCLPDNSITEQLFVFPGTHSKHITTSNTKAVACKTFMTGEFFDLLTNKSILTGSVAKTSDLLTQKHFKAFELGVNKSLEENILHSVFTTRINHLFGKLTSEENYFYLSGLLIGSELSSLKLQSLKAIFLVGQGHIIEWYKRAIAFLYPQTTIHTIEGKQATLQAHGLFYQKYFLTNKVQ